MSSLLLMLKLIFRAFLDAKLFLKKRFYNTNLVAYK